MKPIYFKEVTTKLQKPPDMTHKECGPLPIFTDGKECISCWKLSFGERIKTLFFGKVWLSVRSGRTQQPVWLSVDKTIFLNADYGSAP